MSAVDARQEDQANILLFLRFFVTISSLTSASLEKRGAPLTILTMMLADGNGLKRLLTAAVS